MFSSFSFIMSQTWLMTIVLTIHYRLYNYNINVYLHPTGCTLYNCYSCNFASCESKICSGVSAVVDCEYFTAYGDHRLHLHGGCHLHREVPRHPLSLPEVSSLDSLPLFRHRSQCVCEPPQVPGVQGETKHHGSHWLPCREVRDMNMTNWAYRGQTALKIKV